jgi:hypothetical protein
MRRMALLAIQINALVVLAALIHLPSKRAGRRELRRRLVRPGNGSSEVSANPRRHHTAELEGLRGMTKYVQAFDLTGPVRVSIERAGTERLVTIVARDSSQIAGLVAAVEHFL